MILLPKTEKDEDIQDQMIPYIEEVCEGYSISSELVEAIIEKESGWNPDCKSSAGAIGLMQIMQEFQTERMKKLKIEDLADPYDNILCGIDMIAEYRDRGIEAYEMLIIYRYGEFSDVYRNWTTYGGTVAYADEVLSRSEELEKAHGKIRRQKW